MTTLRPLISANVRRTARRSAPWKSRFTGCPVYARCVLVACNCVGFVACVGAGALDAAGADDGAAWAVRAVGAAPAMRDAGLPVGSSAKAWSAAADVVLDA